MRVAVTGSSGLIGSALTPYLAAQGHEVVRVVRRATQGDGEISWDPAAGRIDSAGFAGVDAVVNLAGKGIGENRGSEKVKREVRDSRVRGTRLIAETLSGLAERPRVLVSASAIGYYGDRGDELLTEVSSSGRGFLAALCREWEAATVPASEAGVRVVHLRSGLVLTGSGGLLGRLLPFFRLGAGGRLASGRQWWSWIAIDDEVGLIAHALNNDAVKGAMNATAPNPVRNQDFTRTLARVLRRPAVVPIPRAALQLRLGRDFADDMLGSQRVECAQALATGYQFHHADLEAALRDVLGKPLR
jgi:uncharacterized protein (TIGR01777 family)